MLLPHKSPLYGAGRRKLQINTARYAFTILINVVGLPLARILEVLMKWGVIVPRED